MNHNASRAGSILATARPAPSVNTLTIASAASAVTPLRFVTPGPLTRCLTCQMRARPALPPQAREAVGAAHVQAVDIQAMESHHCRPEGGEEWSST